MSRRPRQIWFDDEMSRNLDDAKKFFKRQFNIEPNDTRTLRFTLAAFQMYQDKISKTPRKKNEFVVKY